MSFFRRKNLSPSMAGAVSQLDDEASVDDAMSALKQRARRVEYAARQKAITLGKGLGGFWDHCMKPFKMVCFCTGFAVLLGLSGVIPARREYAAKIAAEAQFKHTLALGELSDARHNGDAMFGRPVSLPLVSQLMRRHHVPAVMSVHKKRHRTT